MARQKPMRLTEDEKRNLIDGIEEAMSRIWDHSGELTEEDARRILKETVRGPLYDIPRTHTDERMLP